MVVEHQIERELADIAQAMNAPPPREDIEQLIARKRREQGIEPCRENDAQQLGTLAGPRSTAPPR